MTEHVALVGRRRASCARPGPRSAPHAPRCSANAEALAASSATLPAAEVPFLRSWTAHLMRVERYAAARAAGSSAEAGLIRGYPAELGRLLAEHVRGLPAQSSRTELEPALAAMLDAVDARRRRRARGARAAATGHRGRAARRRAAQRGDGRGPAAVLTLVGS
jgi:hypothetical protein